MQPLTRLRLRLTAWYVGTFAAIMLTLGGLLFVTISRQIAARLDRSLAGTTAMIAARIRTTGTISGPIAPMLPNRSVYILDASAQPMRPDTANRWVREAARGALRDSVFSMSPYVGGERSLHLASERVTPGVRGSAPVVVVSAAGNHELEDAYTGLILAFALAALAGLALVSVGGVLVARKSSAPVERAFEQMRRFMADAAHELRTPVAVIRAEAEVALAREHAGTVDAATTGDDGGMVTHTALARVVRECEALGGIVDDLLTLARADAGEWPRVMQEVSLGDVALDAAQGVEALAARRGVALDVGACDDGTVAGDAALLRRLLLIVLDNAVKYTECGGRVHLEVLDDGGAVRAIVSDTGPGITPSDLPRVFDRFFRGGVTPGRPPGAGLGLSIARWITTVHAGSIVIRPRLPHGTVVTVTLPTAHAALSSN